MDRVKDLILRPIEREEANACVRRLHYSGKTSPNSQIHIGVFWQGALEGALQFGPSMDKRRMVPLVTGTAWHEFLELNRMAFSERLPRNSESRALAVACRLLRKHAPHVKWFVTFADGAQCGDGTIYRAAGFILTAIKANRDIWEVDGEVFTGLAYNTGQRLRQRINAKLGIPDTGTMGRGVIRKAGARLLPGFQLRYVKFLDESWRPRLACAELPYSAIDEVGARMARGERVKC